MREEIEIKGSVDYDKISDRPLEQYTDTPSETVYRIPSVYHNDELRKFKNVTQKVSKENRMRAEAVAISEGCKTFNDVLDIYWSCYSFVKDLSRRLGVPFNRVPQEVERYLPKDLEDLITLKISELLETFNINGSDEAPIAVAIGKILREVILKRRPAVEVVKPLLLLDEEVDVDEET